MTGRLTRSARALAGAACALLLFPFQACGPAEPRKADCSGCPTGRSDVCASDYEKCTKNGVDDDDCQRAADLYCRYGAFVDSDGGVGDDGGPDPGDGSPVS